MKTLIVAGGKAPQMKLLKEYAESCEIIIGADKGCNYLIEADIQPGFIVGDFDSADTLAIDELVRGGAEKIQYNPDKDYTDSEIAFKLAMNKGAREITFFSVTGSRFDHSISNLGLLKLALKENISAQIIDDNNIIMLVNKDVTLKFKEGYKYISFLPYGESVTNLCITGAKYELKDYFLETGDSRTVSNEFQEDNIHITLGKGLLLVIYARD